MVGLTVLGIIGAHFLYKYCIESCFDLYGRHQAKKRALNLEDADHWEGDDDLKNAIADDHSDDILKEMNIRFLRELYIRSKKEFE